MNRNNARKTKGQRLPILWAEEQSFQLAAVRAVSRANEPSVPKCFLIHLSETGTTRIVRPLLQP